MDGPPPPPPPPHGENPQSSSGGADGKRAGLPEGNYDIFIVPPQSSGGGFIYFPSLQPQRNSFIAGCICTLALVGIWWVITPVLKEWFAMIIASGGAGVALLLVVVAGGAWGLGRVTFDTAGGPTGGTGPGAGTRNNSQGRGARFDSSNSYSSANGGPNGFHQGSGTEPPPQSGYYRQNSYNFNSNTSSPPPPRSEPDESAKESAKGAWERAREETRKREEEKKKADELRRKADELRRQREEAEKEKQKQREKEAKEKEVRERRERLVREREERLKKDKEAKEKEEQDKEKERILREAREKEAKEKVDREARIAKLRAEREERIKEQKAKEERERAASATGTPPKPPTPRSNFKQASARTEADHETLYSYRPYDKPKSPKKAPTAYTSSHSSFAASSYAASESTARTTPPPSSRNGPYSTKDPEKIVIKAVYSFNSALNRTPLATLQSGIPPVSDGLVLRISTEGMFIDDDVRGVPQREWDVKAWTLKSVETGQYRGMHILRASLRDSEGKKYVFVFGNDENWKADQGVSRLRKSPQVRALGVSAMGLNEAKSVLELTGWV